MLARIDQSPDSYAQRCAADWHQETKEHAPDGGRTAMMSHVHERPACIKHYSASDGKSGEGARMTIQRSANRQRGDRTEVCEQDLPTIPTAGCVDVNHCASTSRVFGHRPCRRNGKTADQQKRTRFQDAGSRQETAKSAEAPSGQGRSLDVGFNAILLMVEISSKGRFLPTLQYNRRSAVFATPCDGAAPAPYWRQREPGSTCPRAIVVMVRKCQRQSTVCQAVPEK